jgi:serine acetyltransferase
VSTVRNAIGLQCSGVRGLVPPAVIVGGVLIGGAFVTEDVPPDSVVAGNPSSIVKSGAD